MCVKEPLDCSKYRQHTKAMLLPREVLIGHGFFQQDSLRLGAAVDFEIETEIAGRAIWKELTQVKEAVRPDGDCLLVCETIARGRDTGVEADQRRPGGELGEFQVGALADG